MTNLTTSENQGLGPRRSHETPRPAPGTPGGDLGLDSDALIIYLELEGAADAVPDAIEDAALLVVRELAAFGLRPALELPGRALLYRPLPLDGDALVEAIDDNCRELRELLALTLGESTRVTLRLLRGRIDDLWPRLD